MVPKELQQDVHLVAKLIHTELNIYGRDKHISFSCSGHMNRGVLIQCALLGTRGYSDIYPVFIDHDTHRLTSYPETHFTIRDILSQVPWQWVFPAIEIYWEEYNKTVKIANKYMNILNLEYGPNFITPPTGHEKYRDCLAIWKRGVMLPDNMKWRDDTIQMIEPFLFFMCFGLMWITIRILQKCYPGAIKSFHKCILT